MRLINYLPRLLPLVTLTVLALPGCGGGSSKSATVNVSRSKAEIMYGEQVTISWNSSNIDSLDTDATNLELSSGQLSGSITDMPALDTEYKVVGNSADGKVTGIISVSVTKSDKRIALVADAAVSGVPQVRDFVQGLTTQTVVTSLSLPSLVSTDVLVLMESAAIGPAQQSTIKGFLYGGGSVVLVGRAANKLATGNLADGDVTSIGSWFGGANTSQYIGTGGFVGFTLVSSRPAGVPLSAVTFDDWLPFSSGTYVSPVSAQAKVFDTDSSHKIAFAYKPSSGGKVAFAGAAPITSTEAGTSMRIVFLSLVRWAADGS